jgi:hypothetical protein
VIPAYLEWSPAQLAHALGYRINLVTGRGGCRDAFLERAGRSHPTSHERACSTLSRLARIRGIDAANPPTDTPRALINGAEQ